MGKWQGTGEEAVSVPSLFRCSTRRSEGESPKGNCFQLVSMHLIDGARAVILIRQTGDACSAIKMRSSESVTFLHSGYHFLFIPLVRSGALLVVTSGSASATPQLTAGTLTI